MQAPIVDFAFSDNMIWTLAETNEYYSIKNINLETRQISEGGQYGIWDGHTRIFGNNQGLWVLNQNMPDTIMHLDQNADILLTTIDVEKYPGAPYDMIGKDNTLWILLDQGSVLRVTLDPGTGSASRPAKVLPESSGFSLAVPPEYCLEKLYVQFRALNRPVIEIVLVLGGCYFMKREHVGMRVSFHLER